MPLVPAGLASDIADIGADPAATAAGCAALWGDAVGVYASSVVPASATVTAAAAALELALATAFAGTDQQSAIEAAFGAFAVTVAGGMAPAFVAVPPPGDIGFSTLTEPYPGTHAEAGTEIATLIDTWMRTGTATPSGGGAAVPWS